MRNRRKFILMSTCGFKKSPKNSFQIQEKFQSSLKKVYFFKYKILLNNIFPSYLGGTLDLTTTSIDMYVQMHNMLIGGQMKYVFSNFPEHSRNSALCETRARQQLRQAVILTFIKFPLLQLIKSMFFVEVFCTGIPLTIDVACA